MSNPRRARRCRGTWASNSSQPVPARTRDTDSRSGAEIDCQAATFDLNILNAAGRTSNGLKCVVGDF